MPCLLVASAAMWADVQVYVDRGGDGRRGAGEPAVPGAVIGSGVLEVVADEDGRAQVPVQPGEVVWARSFDGYVVPGPWAIVPDGDAAPAIALGLRPQAPPRG